jgi:hypothetical protein
MIAPMPYLTIVRRKAEAALPVIEKMIQADESHNPFLTMNHVKAWFDGGKYIWLSETLDRHGFVWENDSWTRTDGARQRSWALRVRSPNSGGCHEKKDRATLPG